MINIVIGKDRKPSTNVISLGNRWENNTEYIVFDVPDEFKDYNKYILGTIRWKNEPISVVIPLKDNTLIVSTLLTQFEGNWYMNLMCRQSEIDMTANEVDITPAQDEKVFCSNTIIGIVGNGTIDKETFENGLDENIEFVYDELLEKLKYLEGYTPDGMPFNEHLFDTNNPHKVTKEQIGLGKVENKTSTQIRNEITEENIVNALGYTPTNYTHPIDSGYKHIPIGGSEGQVLIWKSDGTAGWGDIYANENDGTVVVPTITVDSELSEVSENPVQNRVIYNELQTVIHDYDYLILDGGTYEDVF